MYQPSPQLARRILVRQTLLCGLAAVFAQWPSTKGVIAGSRLPVGYFKQMRGYYGQIRYQYRAGSTVYQGNRLSFNRTHLAVEDAWQRVIDAYSVGKTVDVHYDPEEPGFAILEPGLHAEMELL